jgi:hypothetical protein
MLDDTTNVADSPQLADRKATKMVDGVPTTGFFVSDFMFSELRELRVKQRLSAPKSTTTFSPFQHWMKSCPLRPAALLRPIAKSTKGNFKMNKTLLKEN